MAEAGVRRKLLPGFGSGSGSTFAPIAGLGRSVDPLGQDD